MTTDERELVGQEVPDRRGGSRTLTAFDIVVVGVITLVLAALLNADGLATRARRLPVGSPWRKPTMTLTRQLQKVTHALSLNRPADALNRYRGDVGERTANGLDPAAPDTAGGAAPGSSADAGGAGGEAAGGEASGANGAVTTVVPDAGGATAGDPATTANPQESAVPTVPAPPRVPTPQDKARVYIAGDSLGKDLAEVLEPLAQKTGVVDAQRRVRVGTGLTRPDIFDWPSQLRVDFASFKPDIIVVEFGGNDTQGIPLPGGKAIQEVTDPQWAVEYGRRVGVVMDLAMAGGRKVIWVGAPMARDEKQNAGLEIIRNVVTAEIAKRPSVEYVDSWTLFKGIGDRYADMIPLDGDFKIVRQKDGFHLNTDGVKYLAARVNEHIVTELRARHAQI